MGQKTNPIGFRLGVSKTWRSTWYAKKDFPALLKEDELLRKYLKARLSGAAISDITIERKPGKVVVTIHTGRPGVVIGKKGQAVEELKNELQQLSGKEVGINVEEIKRPAYLVPSRDEACGAERDADGRRRHQGEVRRPSRRRRNRARRRVP
jgi:small subunit ribosomal protein S3